MEFAIALVFLLNVVLMERRISKNKMQISDLAKEMHDLKNRLGMNVEADQLHSVVELLKANRVEEATQLLKTHKLKSV